MDTFLALSTLPTPIKSYKVYGPKAAEGKK